VPESVGQGSEQQMNSTLDTTKLTRTGSVRRPATRPTKVDHRLPSRTIDADDLIGNRPASEFTRLVFCTLLGIAACLAMIGIVSQASTTATGPDDAPPTVIVDFD